MIDRDVAEKVMGWEPQDIRLGGPIILMSGAVLDNAVKNILPSFSPSTNISDAWLVVERMRELGFGVTIADYYQKELWECCFLGKRNNEGTAAEKTITLAICKAALKALK